MTTFTTESKGASAASVSSNKKPRIGVIYSPSSEDYNEQRYGKIFTAKAEETHYKDQTMGEILGCEFKDIDYNNLFPKGSKFYGIPLQNVPADEINKQLKAIFKEQNLDGVVSPGNWYNVIPEGQNLNKSRELVERAVWNMAKTHGIPLLGICGGEQRWAFEAISEATRAELERKSLQEKNSDLSKQELAELERKSLLERKSHLSEQELEDHQKSMLTNGVVMTNDSRTLTGEEHCPKEGEHKMVHDVILPDGVSSVLRGCATWQGRVTITKGTDITIDKEVKEGKETKLRVNSAHNQAIINSKTNREALARSYLQVTATTCPPSKEEKKDSAKVAESRTDKELVEGIENMFGSLIMLLQFHPEYFARGVKGNEGKLPADKGKSQSDTNGMNTMQKIMRAFVDACETRNIKPGVMNELEKKLPELKRLQKEEKENTKSGAKTWWAEDYLTAKKGTSGQTIV